MLLPHFLLVRSTPRGINIDMLILTLSIESQLSGKGRNSCAFWYYRVEKDDNPQYTAYYAE